MSNFHLEHSTSNCTTYTIGTLNSQELKFARTVLAKPLRSQFPWRRYLNLKFKW